MSRCVGLDIGSTATKAVLLDDGRPVASHVGPSAPDMLAAARTAVERVGGAGAPVLTTGYGRALYGERVAQVSEISALAAGLGRVAPAARTAVDVGGQDSKVVRVEDGRVLDFAMNDRCAAGTGRFLEVMSRVLEIPFDGFDAAVARAIVALPITSTCTVFAESEVVGLLSRQHPPAAILKGVIASVCERVAALAWQVGILEPVAATGGALRSRAVADALARALGVPVLVPPEPQVVTALGAAILCDRRVRG